MWVWERNPGPRQGQHTLLTPALSPFFSMSLLTTPASGTWYVHTPLWTLEHPVGDGHLAHFGSYPGLAESPTFKEL